MKFEISYSTLARSCFPEALNNSTSGLEANLKKVSVIKTSRLSSIQTSSSSTTPLMVTIFSTKVLYLFSNKKANPEITFEKG